MAFDIVVFLFVRAIPNECLHVAVNRSTFRYCSNNGAEIIISQNHVCCVFGHLHESSTDIINLVRGIIYIYIWIIHIPLILHFLNRPQALPFSLCLSFMSYLALSEDLTCLDASYLHSIRITCFVNDHPALNFQILLLQRD